MPKDYPAIPRAAVDAARRVALLTPPDPAAGPVDAVLDTDAFNEIDDQFAIAYALLSPERIRLHALYAAPFVNARATDPATGMQRSLEEIHRVLERLHAPHPPPALAGSTRWMRDASDTVTSAARDDLIARARARTASASPLYVLTIGAPTNVASAVAAAPDIADRIVVVWLGGHPSGWHDTWEFNLEQDIPASRTLLDSGVPLVRVPAANVSQKLRTSVPELERHLRGRNALCDFLCDRFAEYERYECGPDGWKTRAYGSRPIAYSKEIWDVAAVAWLVDPAWAPGVLLPTPLLTDHNTWSHDARRAFSLELVDLHRDPVFGDLFAKLARNA